MLMVQKCLKPLGGVPNLAFFMAFLHMVSYIRGASSPCLLPTIYFSQFINLNPDQPTTRNFGKQIQTSGANCLLLGATLRKCQILCSLITSPASDSLQNVRARYVFDLKAAFTIISDKPRFQWPIILCFLKQGESKPHQENIMDSI